MIGLNLAAEALDIEVVRALAQTIALGKAFQPVAYFLATVTTRRLRPLARRRFST